jgi:hypothetical protein
MAKNTTRITNDLASCSAIESEIAKGSWFGAPTATAEKPSSAGSGGDLGELFHKPLPTKIPPYIDICYTLLEVSTK